MKKLLYLTAVAAFALTATFTACDDEQQEQLEKLIAVLSVKLNVNSVTLPVGVTYTLTPTVLPENAANKNVTWTSSNPAVATVANGTITTKAEGNSAIVAATEDGGKTAICVVTVSPAVVAVTSVTLNQATVTLTADDTLRLTATVQPSNATNKNVTWSSSNTAVATVNNGLVTAVAQGAATITVTTEDGSKTASCAVDVPSRWNSVFGTTSFATTQTWTVGSQEWSDAVQATDCNKTSYSGSLDCRSNPGYKGDLFSQNAVYYYKNQLCPEGWRVPTTQDFIVLDKALGGTGTNNQNNTVLRDSYLNTWGGVYGGYCNKDGTLNYRGSQAYYWSQSKDSSVPYRAYALYFTSDGIVNPWASYPLEYQYFGNSLRCVKDVQ